MRVKYVARIPTIAYVEVKILNYRDFLSMMNIRATPLETKYLNNKVGIKSILPAWHNPVLRKFL